LHGLAGRASFARVRIPRPPHRWSLAPKQAVAVQRQLAGRVRVEPLRSEPRLLAGVDATYVRGRAGAPGIGIGGVVLWDAREGRVVEEHLVRRPVSFPYVPGLLSFREAPLVIAALRRLRRRPEVLLCDGQGLAHPRRFGLACHVGVLCDLPTIGVAKSPLVGSFRAPGPRRGARTRLCCGGETLAWVLRTRDGTKPVFVSVGHRVDLASAARCVLGAARGRRLPEPTRLADARVGAARRALP
jgi:deoxyribonuclease V